MHDRGSNLHCPSSRCPHICLYYIFQSYIILSYAVFCIKGWDDPSVVPSKETYEDWTDIQGLDGAGQTSLFPHMTAEWQELAERRTKELLESSATISTAFDDDDDEQSLPPPSVRCIRDDQAYAVHGRRQSITEL